MNVLVKIGAGMVLLATLMISGFYSYLKAEGNDTILLANNKLKTENRIIDASVTQIDVSGPIEFTLKQGNTPSLVIRSDERYLQKINTTQSGNNLSIEFNDHIAKRTHAIEVEITLPNLAKLSVRGSGDSHVSGFKGEQLQLSLSGSGDMDLQGQYQKVNANLRGSGDLDLKTGNSNSVELDIVGSGSITASGQSKSLITRLNGSGDLDANKLRAENVSVSLNGSGNTFVYAQQSVNVELRGSGDVSVAGKPAQRNVSKQGSGDVDFK